MDSTGCWPDTWALFDWYQARPLVEQWARLSRSGAGARLACWIRVAERDEWTFDQLRRLLANLHAAGADVPAALQEWALDVAAGFRRRPSRSGPKGNRTQDFALAVEALWRNQRGESKRAIERDLARRIHRSEDAVRVAIKRGYRVP